jgi:enediyne biosynthesis protein E5
VAFVEMVLRLNEVVYAPFYALFLVGPAAMVIEDWLSAGARSTAGGQTSKLGEATA